MHKQIELFPKEFDPIEKYTKLLYMQARLIGGLSVEDPSEFSKLISELMV